MTLTALDLLLILLLLALTVLVVYALIRRLTLGIRDDLAEALALSYADGRRSAQYGPYWVLYGDTLKGPFDEPETAERAQEIYAEENPTQGVHLLESIDVTEPRALPVDPDYFPS